MAVIIFIAGIIFSIVSLKYFSFPYFIIFSYWLVCFGALSRFAKKTLEKSIWFNLAFAVLLFGLLEGYSYFSLENLSGNVRREGEYNKGYFSSNEILGYAPDKRKTITSRKYYGDQLIYDATYTINDLGLRVSLFEEINNDQCILFFGGSFTFGEGVNDYETMPYVVQELSGYQVYNFGFHGYGPHQMLSAIQHGMVEEIVDCHPKIVVYQALIEHVARSAGYSSWDHHGPKYILQSNGSVSYAGHFDDRMTRKIVDQLAKSFTYKKFLQDRKNIDKSDLELFIRIIAFSRDLVKKKYPAAEFHVIYWDRPDHKFNEAVMDGLENRNISLHLINEILPDYSTNKYRYIFDYSDGHPKPEGHQRIARYIVERLIPKE